jgi:small-conductance mechanosensitive channel
MKRTLLVLALVVAGLFATPSVATASAASLAQPIVQDGEAQTDSSTSAVDDTATDVPTEGEGEKKTKGVDEAPTTDQLVSGASETAAGMRDVVVAFMAEKLSVPKAVASMIGTAIMFILILIVFKILASIASSIVGSALSKSKLKPTQLLLEFLKGATAKLVMAIGFIMALGTVGVDVGPLLAGLGVLGFVVGFALQDTLGNFAAGVMILLYRPYDIGDFITAGGVTGSVKSMSLVSTTIGTPDNQVQIVPNGSIWGGVITNVTANDTRRVDLTAGIGYGDDMDKAEAILKRIVESHPLVLAEPAPVIRVHALADSSVNIVVRPWTKTSDYWTVYWDITKSIKTEFDKEGVSIPFPQRDVHLYKVD